MKAVVLLLAVISATCVLGDESQLQYIQDSLKEMVNLVDQSHKTQVELIKSMARFKIHRQLMRWWSTTENITQVATPEWSNLKEELRNISTTVQGGVDDSAIDMYFDHVMGSNSSISRILEVANGIMKALNYKIKHLAFSN